jgi:lipoprotein NlpD
VSKPLVPYWLLIVVAGVLMPGCGSTSGSAPVYDRTPAPNTTAVESRPTAVPKKSAINDAAAGTKSAVKTAPAATVKAVPTDDTKTYREGDWRPEYYVVRKGDTLYSIALDFGQDYRDLASWNALEDAAYIQIGQRIRLFPPDGQSGSAASAAAMPPAATPPGNNTAQATVSAPTFSDPKAYRAAYSEQAYADAKRVLSGEAETPAITTTVAKPQPAPVTAPPVVAAAPKPATESGTARTDGTLSWEWPAPGKVLYGFSDGPIKKGVGIGGSPGQAVVSSAPGKVVYSGSGLRGYGNLIIVKHNDTYLSVYALNKQLLVKEGQMVAQGQKIAVMGETNGQPELHFEIRRQGKPVDPLKLLPDRS